MRLEINLPKRVDVDDYHEFKQIEDNLRLISNQLRVKEVGFNGCYVGIIYEQGFFTSPPVQNMVSRIKKECED